MSNRLSAKIYNEEKVYLEKRWTGSSSTLAALVRIFSVTYLSTQRVHGDSETCPDSLPQHFQGSGSHKSPLMVAGEGTF